MAKKGEMTLKERREKFEQDAGYRREIFVLLLKHVERGYSLDCFEYAALETIKKYLSVYKEEWCQEELEEAKRKGKIAWESIGYRQANGECLGNSRSWYYNMANRYGWREKIDIEAEHKGQVSVNIVSYASQSGSDVDEK